MKRRYVYDPQTKTLREVSLEQRRSDAPFVQPDLPGYVSPVTGKWVEGRRARREDLLRTNSRPYEGREQEAKEAAKVQQANERKLDQLAEKLAYRAWDQAPERIRKVFRGR